MDENLKTKVKKSLPIIIAIVAALVILLVILFFTLGRKTNNVNISALTLETDKPIPFEKDNLYGYISSANGKELIQAKYKSVKSFYGKYAVVEKEEDHSTVYCIIDRKGNEQISSSTNIKFYSDYELYIINGKLYNSDLKELTNDDYQVTYKDFGFSSYIKYNNEHKPTEGGILNQKGKKVYSYKFNKNETYFGCSVSQSDERLGEVYAKTIIDNKKYGIVNLTNGKLVYDYTEKSILVDDNNIFSVYSDDQLTSVLCYYDNKLAYETSDKVEISYYDINEKVLQIYNPDADSSNKYSYYDLKSQSVLSENPVKNTSSSLESLTGYNSFSENGKYGVMKNTKVILSADYNDVEFLSPAVFNYVKSKKRQELVIVKFDNLSKIVNLKNNQTIFEVESSTISTYSSSTFVKYTLPETGEICIYNLISNKYMKFSSDSKVSIYSNYIIVEQNNNKKYYNVKLHEIYSV